MDTIIDHGQALLVPGLVALYQDGDSTIGDSSVLSEAPRFSHALDAARAAHR